MPNLFQALQQAFPADKTQTAIHNHSSGRDYSYADIEQHTARLANLFGSLNLPAGSRIAVQTEKSVEALFVYLAVLRAGYTYLPLNTAYQSAEVDYFIGNAEPAVLVCTQKTQSWMQALADKHQVPHCYTLEDNATGSLLDAAQAHSTEHTVAHKADDDLAAILYTSGTTGRSKGAMLSHRNLLSNAQTLVQSWGFSNKDVLIHALPIFHVHGLFVASHCALLSGTKMIWLNKFEPATVLHYLPQATVFMGVPTLYVRLLGEAHLNQTTAANMRLFVAGSAPLLIETFNDFKARTGHTILERYGMSETVMLTSNPYNAADGERRGGTVGFALPSVGVRVHSSEGKACSIDEIGNIEVSGPNVFAGYWRMPDKTKEEFTADGWFKTGDVGKLDAQGYFSIVGRSKDLIISGGYNVYPAEIEGYLNDMPGVAESAVIGVPHPDFGEAVVAVVVAKAGASLDSDAMVQTLKTMIANFKVPKRLYVVNELPRNTMGKVQKNALRSEHSALFV
jgi:malonyl-CoA/methylmalonyl-CoA synthetase